MLDSENMVAVRGADGTAERLRVVVAIAGAVYLVWWFAVEFLLPGSFNPLFGRLVVVGANGLLLAASYRIAWVESHLSALFTAWVCLLVAHYCSLLVGNHGESTWWVGAFITFAAASMCLQTPRQVAAFSAFAFAGVLYAAAVEGQLRHTIYLPGLATILLLANISKRSQSIAQDATLRAELARRETRHSNLQRLQLAAIVESSGDAIIAVDLDGAIRSWNGGAARLFGYSADDAVGRPITMLLPPGGQPEELHLIARLPEGDAVAPFEAVRRRRDGADVDVSVAISPIRDWRGELSGASVAARDISERRRAGAEVQHAREAAEAANRELETFSYSVAHDLRAPLRAMDGFSRILLEDYREALDPGAQDLLERVRRNAEHMGRLIDGLLALARVTRTGIRNEQVDLSALAHATAGRLRASQPERLAEFMIGDGFVERGDGALLGAVVENLLGNAWKFTRNEPNARIEMGSTEDQGRRAYFVKDNGAGFDMNFATRLFGVFQRLHSAKEFEGTGIGLATAQRIMKRHGGRIWAEGKVGAGACFYFSFGDGRSA